MPTLLVRVFIISMQQGGFNTLLVGVFYLFLSSGEGSTPSRSHFLRFQVAGRVSNLPVHGSVKSTRRGGLNTLLFCVSFIFEQQEGQKPSSLVFLLFSSSGEGSTPSPFIFLLVLSGGEGPKPPCSHFRVTGRLAHSPFAFLPFPRDEEGSPPSLFVFPLFPSDREAGTSFLSLLCGCLPQCTWQTVTKPLRVKLKLSQVCLSSH
jgi:hypothetical protein